MTVALYTIDVGHGLCQVILFPGRRAVVIDGGRAGVREIVSEFLHHYVDHIITYIATHNDRDHVGAAIHFLDGYTRGGLKTIGEVWVLIDRGSYSDVPIVTYALERARKGTIEGIRQGCIDDGPTLKKKRICEVPTENARVDLLYPRPSENMSAILQKKPSPRLQNHTSAVIRLEVGDGSALITGDADLGSFTWILDEYGFSLRADILSVPHHGGSIPDVNMPNGKRCRSWAEIVAAVRPDYGVVSCGSDTRVRRDSLEPIRAIGATLCCTEITAECYPNPAALHPSVSGVDTKIPGVSGQGGFPKSVACFGSSCFVFDGGPPYLVDEAEHQTAVDNMVAPSGAPCCRERQ